MRRPRAATKRKTATTLRRSSPFIQRASRAAFTGPAPSLRHRATSDGHVALIAMGGRTWPNLVAAFNPDWERDPRFATARDRELNREALSDEFGAVISRLTTADCLERMRVNDIAGAAVIPLDEIANDPKYAREMTARGRIRAAEFSWIACAEATAAAYRSVASGFGA